MRLLWEELEGKPMRLLLEETGGNRNSVRRDNKKVCEETTKNSVRRDNKNSVRRDVVCKTLPMRTTTA